MEGWDRKEPLLVAFIWIRKFWRNIRKEDITVGGKMGQGSQLFLFVPHKLGLEVGGN